MFDILLEYGFSKMDVLMLTCSPLLGALGGFIRAGLMISPIDKIHNTKNTSTFNPFNLAAGWLIVGAVTGLLVSLLFVGALKEEPSAISRVFALSLIAGYSAAQFWTKQEKLVEKEINKYLGEESSDDKKKLI